MELLKWSWIILTIVCLRMDISQGLVCGVCKGATPECLRHYWDGPNNSKRRKLPTGDCPEWCFTCAPNKKLEGDWFERGCIKKKNEYKYGLMNANANSNAHPGGGTQLPKACHLTICNEDKCNNMGWDNITSHVKPTTDDDSGETPVPAGRGGHMEIPIFGIFAATLAVIISNY